MGVDEDGCALPRLRCLLVEDEALVVMLLEDILSELGHDLALAVASVEAGMDAVKQETFDFAFLDVNLAGKKSFDIARLLQKRAIPFAFLSGYGRDEMSGDWSEVPAISKPFHVQEIKDVLTGMAGHGFGNH